MPLSSLLLVLGRVITKPAMTCGHLASYCSPLRYGLVWRMLQVDAKEGPIALRSRNPTATELVSSPSEACGE
jgi:hypothetical protein